MLSNDQIKIYNKLGIPLDYGEKNNLVFYNDAIDLVDVGSNIIGNRQKLSRKAALHWFKRCNPIIYIKSLNEGRIGLTSDNCRLFDCTPLCSPIDKSKLGALVR